MENEKIISFKIIQELRPNADDCLRMHKIDISVYNENMNEIVKDAVVDARRKQMGQK